MMNNKINLSIKSELLAQFMQNVHVLYGPLIFHVGEEHLMPQFVQTDGVCIYEVEIQVVQCDIP